MDSYVDKLSQRFNAGEMIKANGEAEALEIERLKTQVTEYDKILQEMRRLNLKNIEVSEQVTQLVQSGIEQIESYQSKVESTETAVGRETEIVKEVVENGIEQQKADFLKISSNQQDMLIETIDRQQRMMDTFTTESAKSQQEAVKRVEDRLMTLRAAVEESLGDMETSLKSGAKDYEPILLALHNEIVSNEKFDENLNQLKEMLVKLRLLMDEHQKQMSDFVHKENVKVYRNVQAVVNEQTSFQSKQIFDRMEQLEKKVSKPNVVAILTFLMAAGAFAIEIMRLMGML